MVKVLPKTPEKMVLFLQEIKIKLKYSEEDYLINKFALYAIDY